MDRRCQTCLWWKPGGGSHGECHRYAPRPKVVPLAGSDTAVAPNWPLVDYDDFCGEWQHPPVQQQRETQP